MNHTRPAAGAPNKTVFVNQLEESMSVQSIFVITQKNLREYDRGKFLTLRLGDKTGKINAILWDKAEEIAKTIQEGDLVEIKGHVKIWRSERQITLGTNIRKVEDLSGVNPHDFLPVAPVPLEEMTAEFDSIVESMADEHCKALLGAFRGNAGIWEKFSAAPGGKMWHHAYLHGLLHHTLMVARQCDLIAPFHPRVDRDLLVTGAILHDSGKMDELVYNFNFDYSTMGRLLGHIFIGANLVEKLIEGIPGFPADTRQRLLHMILSHHGEIERSPVTPMTIEACLLHHIENMDAQLSAFSRELGKAEAENQEWTGYVKLIDRYLYAGEGAAPAQTNDNGEI